MLNTFWESHKISGDVRNIGCFSRGLSFYSQLSNESSQLSITALSEYWVSSSILFWHSQARCVQTHAGKISIHMLLKKEMKYCCVVRVKIIKVRNGKVSNSLSSVILFVYVCVCGGVCTHVGLLHAQREVRCIQWTHFIIFALLTWHRVFQWIWSSMVWVGLPANESLRSTKVKTPHIHAWSFMWVLGI